MEHGFHVFAINPKQLHRFRVHHTIAGAKDDRRDAFVLVDSLRTDRQSFRRVHLKEPQLFLLRELSRTEETLLEELQRATNRLREQLQRLYPQMLHVYPAANAAWLWALLELAPTPTHATLLTEEQVRGVLKTHRIRRLHAAEVLESLCAPALPETPGTTDAAQAHIALLLPCIRVFAEHLKICARQVETLLAALAVPDEAALTPSDVEVVWS